jgi:hypothetical protein
MMLNLALCATIDGKDMRQVNKDIGTDLASDPGLNKRVFDLRRPTSRPIPHKVLAKIIARIGKKVSRSRDKSCAIIFTPGL